MNFFHLFGFENGTLMSCHHFLTYYAVQIYLPAFQKKKEESTSSVLQQKEFEKL